MSGAEEGTAEEGTAAQAATGTQKRPLLAEMLPASVDSRESPAKKPRGYVYW